MYVATIRFILSRFLQTLSTIRKSSCFRYVSLESVFNSEENSWHQTSHFVIFYEKYIVELVDFTGNLQDNSKSNIE